MIKRRILGEEGSIFHLYYSIYVLRYPVLVYEFCSLFIIEIPSFVDPDAEFGKFM